MLKNGDKKYESFASRVPNPSKYLHADIYFSFEVDDDGRAPLHYAASNGLGDVIKILADNGVDLAAQVCISLF